MSQIAIADIDDMRPASFQDAKVGSHSTLMLAARITFAHFSVSSPTNFSNSAGGIGIGTAPKSARLALNFGSARVAPVSLLSLSMTSAGVPAGRRRDFRYGRNSGHAADGPGGPLLTHSGRQGGRAEQKRGSLEF
jgi:hypothetical protein